MAQVKKDHYAFSYESPERFQLYYHICSTAIDLSPENVLEVGIGSQVVSNLLKVNGVAVTTVDFAPDLAPDIVGDVRNLPVASDSYDVVICSQVLEHLPFEEVEKAVRSLCSCTRKYCIISVPYNRNNFSFYFSLQINKYLSFRGMLNKWLDKYGKFYFNVGFSQKNREMVFDGEHHWEIGYKGYPISRLQQTFSKYAQIEREFRVPLSPYHYLFVLRKL